MTVLEWPPASRQHTYPVWLLVILPVSVCALLPSHLIALVDNTKLTWHLSLNSRRLRTPHLFVPRDRAQHHSSIHPGPSRPGPRQDQVHPQGILERHTTNPAEQVGHDARDAKVCAPGRADTQARFVFCFICMSFWIFGFLDDIYIYPRGCSTGGSRGLASADINVISSRVPLPIQLITLTPVALVVAPFLFAWIKGRIKASFSS